MKLCWIKVVSLTCFLVVFLVSSNCYAKNEADQYEYIDISNPFLRKIPLAVPVFKNVNDSPKEKELSKKGVDLLADSLEFTGYFKLLDREAFLFDPQKDGVLATDVNYRNWTVVGAELLVTGLYEIQNGEIKMELRLFETVKGKRVLGKRYTGRAADQRSMILRFCSEVIYYLTGNKGVYSSKIAFISNGSGHKEIYTCDFDGYNPRRLTHNNSISLFPDWSTDGKWMAYTSYKGGKPDLYIREISSKRERVVAREGINMTPSWVPGKLELAATLSFSGDQEIYLLTEAGKIIKRLTNKRGSDLSPTWSPDGMKMAFVSNRSGTPQIYVMDVASRKVRRLTYEGRYNTQPNWSPSGDKIVYSSMAGVHNIFVIGSDGQNPIQLTYDSGDNEAPSWSPDGGLIVFSSTREGPSRLYVMTAFGTDQRRLLLLNGEQTNPKWSMNHINN